MAHTDLPLSEHLGYFPFQHYQQCLKWTLLCMPPWPQKCSSGRDNKRGIVGSWDKNMYIFFWLQKVHNRKEWMPLTLFKRDTLHSLILRGESEKCTHWMENDSKFRAWVNGLVPDKRGSCTGDLGSIFFLWMYEVESKVEEGLGWGTEDWEHFKIGHTGKMRRQLTKTMFLKACLRNTNSTKWLEKKVFGKKIW